VDFTWDLTINQCAVISLVALIDSSKRCYGNMSPKTQSIFAQSFEKLLGALCQTDEPESGIIVVSCLKNFARRERDLLRVTQSKSPDQIPQIVSSLITAVELWGYHFDLMEEKVDHDNYDEYSREFMKQDMSCFYAMSKEISLLM